MSRFAVHDFLIGNPVLIDRKTDMLYFYRKNYTGRVYNLEKPEMHHITAKIKAGLIQRTHGNYSIYTSRSVDGYIYKYLMNDGQREQCGSIPHILGESPIVETDSYSEAITRMCEWTLENERYHFDTEEEREETGKANIVSYQDYLKKHAEPPQISRSKKHNLHR